MRAPFLFLLLAASCFAAPLDDLTARAEAAAVGPVEYLPANRAALLESIPVEPLTYAGRPVPLDWLREAATDGDRPELVRAWERLKAWREVVQPGPELAAEQVRAETAAILGRDEYQPLRAASWIDPWLPYIERFFDWLFAPFTRRSSDPSSAATGLGIALYTVLSLLLAAWLAGRLRRQNRRRVARQPDGAVRAAAAPDAAQWWEAAERGLAEGRLTAACAAAWQGLVRRLDETEVLAYDPSRTPREVAAAVTRPELAEELLAAAHVAEACLFGGQTVTEAQVRALLILGQHCGSTT